MTGGGVPESGTDRARASGGPPILVRLPAFFLIVVLWKGCAGGALARRPLFGAAARIHPAPRACLRGRLWGPG